MQQRIVPFSEIAEKGTLVASDYLPCPQAWHGGLPVGLLVECKYSAKHKGWHRNAEGNLEWGGKLTDEEMAMADALRQAKGE
jgi:hypothetical protein